MTQVKKTSGSVEDKADTSVEDVKNLKENSEDTSKPKQRKKKEKPVPVVNMPTSAQLALNQLNKAFGSNFIMRLGDNPSLVDLPGQISTGSLLLDFAIGAISRNKNGTFNHGVPKGRIVEVYGPESCGKTTLCNQIVAKAQKSKGLCAFVDMEQCWDKEYARKIGVDVENLVICQPNCAEEALQSVEALVRSNSFSVIVLDSVASLVTRAELEGDIGDSYIGKQAKLMSEALRKLTPLVNESSTCLIFTNQIRYKIGVMFGNPETTPGGEALKFYASIRMDLRRSSVIKDNSGEQIGHIAKVRVVKNKIDAPFKTAEFDMLYGIGVDKFGELAEAAVKYGVVEKSGSWFSYGDKSLGQGKGQVRAFLKENSEVMIEIYNKVMNKYLESQVPGI